LPSPLCDKEYEEIIRGMGRSGRCARSLIRDDLSLGQYAAAASEGAQAAGRDAMARDLDDSASENIGNSETNVSVSLPCWTEKTVLHDVSS